MTLCEQLTLEQAIESVCDHANPAWKRAARQWIRDLTPGREFMGEDLRAELDLQGLATFDLRELGNLCKAARDDGLIERVGWRAAKTSHLSPKGVWRRTEKR